MKALSGLWTKRIWRVKGKMGWDSSKVWLQARYRKGHYNTVADALRHMPKINLLLFTELKNELLESLRGKCKQDSSYSKVWNHVQMRGPSHSNGSVPISSTHSSSLSQDELLRWKKNSIDDGYLLHKGRVCVPLDLEIWRQILYECRQCKCRPCAH